jgi:hypothetical protein
MPHQEEGMLIWNYFGGKLFGCSVEMARFKVDRYSLLGPRDPKAVPKPRGQSHENITIFDLAIPMSDNSCAVDLITQRSVTKAGRVLRGWRRREGEPRLAPLLCTPIWLFIANCIATGDSIRPHVMPFNPFHDMNQFAIFPSRMKYRRVVLIEQGFADKSLITLARLTVTSLAIQKHFVVKCWIPDIR